MPTVFLGNSSVIVPATGAHAVGHNEGATPDAPTHTPRPDLGQQITTVTPPEGLPVADQVTAVANFYASQSDQPPAWVESDDEVLAAAVAAHYGCPVGSPNGHDSWKEG